MTDLISATLREQADGDIHIESLLSAVHTGARRRRRRHVGVAAFVVVAVAALAAAGGVAIWRTREAPVGVAQAGDIPRPPLLEGVPVATQSPTAIGADPTLFHLDLTGLDGWGNLAWSSAGGYEDLQGFSADAGGDFLIEAAQERDRLSGQAGEIGYAKVNGVDAESVRVNTQAPGVPNSPNGRSALRWEAAPDVWVQVVVPAGLEVAMRIAERVRLDRTYRCAVPFRLTGLDPKVHVVKCQVWFSGAYALGGVWMNNGPQNYENYTEYYVATGKPDPAPAPTETIGGRAVAIETPTGEAPRIVYPYDGGAAYFYPFYTTLDDPFLQTLVPAFQPVTSADPQEWPRSPLG